MTHEVVLRGEIYQADNLQRVVEKTIEMGMSIGSLKIDPVIDRETDVPTTTQTPILYLENTDILIMQGPKDSKYRMFKYRWIQ